MEKQPDYEAAFCRLEEIASLLEQGSLPLEQSLKLFEEGTKLAAQLSVVLNINALVVNQHAGYRAFNVLCKLLHHLLLLL